jgi:Uma2 family endonuclease
LLSADDDGIVVVTMRSVKEMAAAPKLMTVDDYFNTPETVKPMELIFGALRVAEAPTPRHQSAVADLFVALDTHVRQRQLGKVWLAPLDVVLDNHKALIVQPDLLFISNEREWIVRDRVRGAPDLVVEVLSPNPRIGRIEERVDWFAQYGVRECWLVHQDHRQVTVIELAAQHPGERRLYAARQPIQSIVLPEFAASLEEILARD